MPNALTGDFDAVVQISVDQINGLLAALHQNGANSNSPLKLLHSVRTRIGDPRRPRPEFEGFGDWVAEYARRRTPGPRLPIRDLLTVSSPPGVARLLDEALADLDGVFDPAPPETIRGTATVQLSTVQISVPSGSSSEVTVDVGVRAHYEPDAGTTPLPERVHGTVRAVFEVTRSFSAAGTRLRIRPSQSDQKIGFTPGAGSAPDSGDLARINATIRSFVRGGIELLPVDLPAGFPFSDFKGVGNGPSAAVALPLQLTGPPLPPSALQGVTQSFVSANGFAFAVGREHVLSLIDVDAIREGITQRPIRLRVSVLGFSGTVTYRLRFSSGPTLTLLPGAFEVSGRVEVETGTWWAPNGFVRFRQRFRLRLNQNTQQVSPRILGDPTVDSSWFIPESIARNVVRNEVQNALSANAPAIRGVFEDARTSLASALRTFESTASARYADLEISTDGVIVRGDVGTAPRIAPVLQVEEIDGGRFSAFRSWIPGGQIDRFDWTWIEYPNHSATPWSGVVKFATEIDTFLLTRPQGVSSIGQICLRVVGSRIRPDGTRESAALGQTHCQIADPVIGFDGPSWWGPVTVPVWSGPVADSELLSIGISAHVSVQSDRPLERPAQNALIFFPDWKAERPFEAFTQSLSGIKRTEAQLVVWVVVPEGAFDVTRREFEARVSALRGPYRHQFAEDVEGGWTAAFDVSARPALFLINARRAFGPRFTGSFDPREVADAIDRHIIPAPGSVFRPLNLRVSPGDLAPDFPIAAGGDAVTALRRLRGTRLAITFWQEWSAPCHAELARLDSMYASREESGVRVIAFHGGARPIDFDAFRKEHGLRIELVNDAEHRVARAFGVRCWPTTIEIDVQGRVESTRFGHPRQPPKSGLEK